MFKLCVFAAIFALAAAKTCPNPDTVDSLDIPSYFSGRWYEIAKSEGFANQFEKGMECITADYYFNKCDKVPVAVINNGLKEDGTPDPARGRARQAVDGQAKFEVSFFGPFFGPYWVIHTEANDDTDVGVAIVYSCSKTQEAMWILSRTPELPSSTSLDKVFGIARSKGIDVEGLKMLTTKQQSDDYSCNYPDPESIAGKPESDDGCTFGITGCKPASWCSYQFKWGDFTPNQSCRLKPTDCDQSVEAQPEKDAVVPQNGSSKSGVSLPVAVVVGAVAGVAVVAVAAAAWFVKSRRTATDKNKSLLYNEAPEAQP